MTQMHSVMPGGVSTGWWHSSVKTLQPLKRVAAMAITMAILLTVVIPFATFAWVDAGKQWPQGDFITTCVGDEFTTGQKNTISTALRLWNDIGANVILDDTPIQRQDCNASNSNIEFKIETPSSNTPMQSIVFPDRFSIEFGHDGVARYRIEWADILVNPGIMPGGSAEAWWSNANQGCTVGPNDGCRSDARSMLMHEIGHALGFGHSLGGSCNDGFDSTNFAAACSGNSVKIMKGEGDSNCFGDGDTGVEFRCTAWKSVGSYEWQGYRHNTVGGDIENGLVDMYGP